VIFRRALDVTILTAATALTRFWFRSRYLYDIDSVNFALALRRFNPGVHQPHPPGYFLYVCLGRLVNYFLHDANAAFVAISIAFSCGAVITIYILTDNWFGRNAAIFAGLVFIFSPLAWFHGTVALTYIVETFFSALTGYLCWRLYRGNARFILPAAVVAGVAAGFRPSSLLFLGPLLLFSFSAASRKQAACGIGALALTLLAWFVPMITICGAADYFSSLLSLWRAVPSRGTVFNSPVWNSFARACVIAGIYLLCFGVAAALPFRKASRDPGLDRRKILFTRVWIAPSLLFFTFVFLKFVNSGYLLVLIPPVCAWMGLRGSTWYADLRLRSALKIAVVGGCAAANTLIFIFAPVYCSYGAVRRFERELENIVGVLPQLASARDTMIVGFDSHFLGYRHAGYYLPGYLTVEFPEVRLASGTKVFAMRDRNTRAESGLALDPSIRNFIIFPLPSGETEYRDYMTTVQKRLPPGKLHTIVRGGHEYSIGRVMDLCFLLPVSAPRTAQSCPRQLTPDAALVDNR